MLDTVRQKLNERFLRNFVFIHINKTAGSSIQAALNIAHEHKTAVEKREFLGANCWNRKFRFTFVRNPWDKVVSHYHYRVQTNQTGMGDRKIDFNEWVKVAYSEKNPEFYDNPKMFMPQVEWIEDESGEVIVDFIGKYENLRSDFETICTCIKRPSLTLPHIKKSDRGDFRKIYTDISIEIVAQHFRRDLETLGYKF